MDRKQLAETLNSTSSTRKRPILTLANGDNTWLISIPRPTGSPGKAFYHILQDPWLSGPSDAFYSWVLRMQHREKEAFGDVQAVEDWIQGIEEAVGGTKGEQEWWLDAVLVTHINTDHLHEATLRSFPPSMKIFAVEGTETVISAMNHFDSVTVVPDFTRGEQWPTTPEVPEGLSIFRLQDESGMYPYIHHAMIIGISTESGGNEMILYAPHGVEPGIVDAAREVNPDANILAMLHPINESGVGVKTKGVSNGLKIERRNKPKYWFNTHNDKIQYTGILSWFLQHGRTTLERGLEEEAKEGGEEHQKPNFVVLGNGDSYILV
ncbi:hypothetical protein EsH8_V_000122 [Colletotrichum jinshuiense]